MDSNVYPAHRIWFDWSECSSMEHLRIYSWHFTVVRGRFDVEGQSNYGGPRWGVSVSANRLSKLLNIPFVTRS